jgi:thiol-disulfide isomerase/thioredoxin
MYQQNDIMELDNSFVNVFTSLFNRISSFVTTLWTAPEVCPQIDQTATPDKTFCPSNKILYLFYADWCHSCQKFRTGLTSKPYPDQASVDSDWGKIFHYYNNSHRDLGITVIEVNCDIKPHPLANKYNFKGFPTIIFVNEKTHHEFRGERTFENLIDFVNGAKSDFVIEDQSDVAIKLHGHYGISTVGSKWGGNKQLRFDPPIPQIPVGPWMHNNSDRLLEIGTEY